MARKRKRKSRRRQEGRKILELVPQYNLESGEDKPVTAARRFISSQGITPPALLIVKRNEHTTDRYFWAEKGLFGAQYVEENHFLFPSLRLVAPQNNQSNHNQKSGSGKGGSGKTNLGQNTMGQSSAGQNSVVAVASR